MRKQLVLLFFVALFALQSSAQIQKKQIYPGLSVGRQLFSYNTNSIQPSLSFGISEHSLVGLFYKYEKFNTHPSISFKGYATKIGVGVSYSYYRHFNKKSKWGWYLDGSLGLYQVRGYKKQNGTPVLNFQVKQTEFTFTPGIFYKPSPRILLFGNVGGFSVNSYQQHIYKHVDFGKQLNLGIKITLGGKSNK